MSLKPYQKLHFKVHEVPHGTELLIKFPQLGAIDEFRKYGKGNRNYVIRYIMYAYDPGSDLVDLYPEDLKQRKEAALIEAGFERNKKDEFDQELIALMELRDEKVLEMIFAYLKIINNKLWMMIVSTEEMFLEYQKLIMKPISAQGDKEKDTITAADMKKKLREECNSMFNDLQKYYKTFFGGNQDLEDYNNQNPIITSENLKILKR